MCIRDRAHAEHKLNEAFEFFTRLGLPYFCFHDTDVMAEAHTIREHVDNLARIGDSMAAKIAATGVKLLWGTANLFSHPRYMAGAASNPDPDVFRFAATQVRHCLELTKRLGGQNYVLWGGREGYDSLLNTDIKQEKAQLGRFLRMVIEHKHKIGFTGTIPVSYTHLDVYKRQGCIRATVLKNHQKLPYSVRWASYFAPVAEPGNRTGHYRRFEVKVQ